jgi:hypothetical protein
MPSLFGSRNHLLDEPRPPRSPLERLHDKACDAQLARQIEDLTKARAAQAPGDPIPLGGARIIARRTLAAQLPKPANDR